MTVEQMWVGQHSGFDENRNCMPDALEWHHGWLSATYPVDQVPEFKETWAGPLRPLLGLYMDARDICEVNLLVPDSASVTIAVTRVPNGEESFLTTDSTLARCTSSPGLDVFVLSTHLLVHPSGLYELDWVKQQVRWLAEVPPGADSVSWRVHAASRSFSITDTVTFTRFRRDPRWTPRYPRPRLTNQ